MAIGVRGEAGPRRTVGRFALVGIVCWIFLGMVIHAAPIDHTRPTRIVRTWTVEDGLPINTVTGIVQDARGYLWLSTFAGLVRFNGVQFETFDSSRYPELPSDRLTTIHVTPEGGLWVSTENHQFASFDGLTFTPLPDYDDRFNGESILRVAQSPSGWLALGTMDGVAMIDAAGPRPILQSRSIGEVKELAWESDELLWVGTSKALYRIADPMGSAPQVDSVEWELHPHVLLPSERGIWIGSNQGLFIATGMDPPELAVPLTDGRVVLRLSMAGDDLIADLDGQIYRITATDEPVLIGRDESGWWSPLTAPRRGREPALLVGTTVMLPEDGDLELSRSALASLLDREGNTWLGLSGGGLVMLSDSPLQILGREGGMPGENVYPVLHHGGAIWAGTLDGGLAVVDDQGPRPFDPGLVALTMAEVDGEVWVAGVAVCRVVGESCVEVPDPGLEEYRMLYQSRDGSVWLAGPWGELFRREADEWVAVHEEIDDWPVTHLIRTVEETSDGSLWFGTNGSGLIRLQGDRVTKWSAESGLSSDLVRDLLVRQGDQLLIATENRGLCRLDLASEAINCLSTPQNLYSSGIHHMEPDGHGRLWMSSNQGIFWVAEEDLNEVLDGERVELTRTGSYNSRNGMSNSEANGGSYPSAARDSEGRIWWPTQGGLVVVDPRVEAHLAPRPDSFVRRVTAAGVSYEPVAGTVELPSGVRSVRVELEAPSFFDPENLQLRARVGSVDDEWFELGRDRTFGPLELGPGSTTVETAARYVGGRWRVGSSPLVIAAPVLWHERPVVRFLLVLLLLGMLVAAFWSRERFARRRERRLSRIVADRTSELEISRQQTLEALERVETLSRRRTELFSELAHEIRTPLTLIRGPVHDARIAGTSLSTDELAGVDLASARIGDLVDQLLDLQRVDEQRKCPELRTLDLLASVRSIATAWMDLASRSGLELALLSRFRRYRAELDEEFLERIVANLLSNAFKYAPAGSTVTVSLDQSSAGEVELRVADAGPGIPETQIEAIFQRYYRSPVESAEFLKGSGIGLSLARDLARLLGGNLAARNRAEGGAELVLTLPGRGIDRLESLVVVAASSERTVKEVLPRGGDSVERRRILVVDDEEGVRDYIRHCLQDRYEVIEAADGLEGFEVALQQLPDLVISDVMMRGADGLELVSRIRSAPETAAIPVILLTAKGLGAAELDGLGSGADDYIAKPFDRHSLRARVDARLRSSERIREAVEAFLGRREDIDSPGDSLGRRFEEIMRNNLGSIEFGVGDLASGMNMSRSSLNRWVRDKFGESPGAVLRRRRLEVGRDLLRRGHAATEAGFAAGFASYQGFFRAFKAEYGVAPSLWKEPGGMLAENDPIQGPRPDRDNAPDPQS